MAEPDLDVQELNQLDEPTLRALLDSVRARLQSAKSVADRERAWAYYQRIQGVFSAKTAVKLPFDLSKMFAPSPQQPFPVGARRVGAAGLTRNVEAQPFPSIIGAATGLAGAIAERMPERPLALGNLGNLFAPTSVSAPEAPVPEAPAEDGGLDPWNPPPRPSVLRGQSDVTAAANELNKSWMEYVAGLKAKGVDLLSEEGSAAYSDAQNTLASRTAELFDLVKLAEGGGGGITAYQSASLGLQQAQLAEQQRQFDIQEERANRQFSEAQAQARELALLREENDIRRQMMANQMQGAGIMGSAWNQGQQLALQGAQASLPPGMEFAPGWQPGGPVESLYSRYGLKGFQSIGQGQTTPFQPYLGVEKTQQAVNQALSNPLMGGR